MLSISEFRYMSYGRKAEKKDSGFDLDGDATTEPKQLPIHRKFLPQAPSNPVNPLDLCEVGYIHQT
jgi:hypothetical protein